MDTLSASLGTINLTTERNPARERDNELAERAEREEINLSETEKVNKALKQEAALGEEMVGAGEDLTYLDDFTSPQYGAADADKREQEFRQIYDKAQEYRQRLSAVQTAGKEKRELPAGIVLMQEIAAILRESGKFPDLKHINFMSVGKLIIDDLKEKEGTTNVEDIRKKAIEIAKNRPEKYVERFRSMPKKEKKSKKQKGGEDDDDIRQITQDSANTPIFRQ